jgi:hypothetical protein
MSMGALRLGLFMDDRCLPHDRLADELLDGLIHSSGSGGERPEQASKQRCYAAKKPQDCMRAWRDDPPFARWQTSAQLLTYDLPSRIEGVEHRHECGDEHDRIVSRLEGRILEEDGHFASSVASHGQLNADRHEPAK